MLVTSLLPAVTAIVVALLGTMLVVYLVQRRPSDSQQLSRSKFDFSCTICTRRMTIAISDMLMVSPQENALIVSATRTGNRRKLAECRCPHCDTEHVFAMDTNPPEWMIANPFEPRSDSARCTQCHRHFKEPSWPSGEYDGRLSAAPDLVYQHGIICSRCGAHCCVECCIKYTGKRTTDGTLLCPRCFRGPVDKVYHF